MNISETNSSIVGIASAVPSYEFDNLNYDILTEDKLRKFIEVTGVKKRRIVKYQLCTSDLAISAGERLLKDLNWNKKDLDFVILITQTPDFLTPATSIIIQNKLGLKKEIFALDINLGCSGFPYGISIINSLMDAYGFSKGLLFIGDVSSKLCNYKDKSTWPLFGDACSAIAFEKGHKKKIISDFYSDGSGYKDIIVPSHSLSGREKLNKSSFDEITDKDLTRNNVNMHLNGANIYSFAISNVSKKIKELIGFYKLDVTLLKYCFLHQANKLINDSIESKIDIKTMKFPSSIENFGNTSSATIPMTITVNFQKNKLNGLSILCGFGVGLSLSTVIIDFNDVFISKLVEVKE